MLKCLTEKNFEPMGKMENTRAAKHIKIAIPIILILVSLITMLVFEKSIVSHNRDTVFLRLEESASDKAKTINTVAIGWYDVLNTLALSIAEQNGNTDAQMAATLKTVNDYSSFTRIAYADTGGYAVDDRGVVFDVAGMSFFADAMDGSSSISETASFAIIDAPAFIVCVPVKKEGVVTGAVLGTYAVTDFETIMTSRIFEGGSYSILCDGDGCVLAQTETEICLTQQTNLFSFLDGKINGAASVESILSDFNGSASGFFTYECGNEEKYAAYRPLGFNGWYLVTIVPESIAANEIMGTQIYEYAAIFVVTLAAVLLFLYHVHYSSKTLRELGNERDVLRQAEERYNIIEEFTETVMFHGDFKTDNIKFGGIYEHIYKRKPMIEHIGDLSKPHPYVLEEDMDQYIKIGRDIEAGIASSYGEYRIQCTDGTVQWHRLEYKILFDKDNRPEQLVGKISNIDAHKREMQIMSIAAETDAMTGLLNQAATRRYIRHFLNGSGKDGLHGFMLIDVDNFKAVNDQMGHAIGNKTLTAVANEIKTAVRATDIVGRMGGDEFIIFIKKVPSIEFLKAKAAEICSTLECVNVKHALNMPISVSIGVSVYDKQGDYDILFEEADTALYTAKAQGKKQYVFFKK